MNSFLIKIRKTGIHKMDKIFLIQNFRPYFLQLYCRLIYQFVSKEFLIKSNKITLNYSLSIAFIRIKNEVLNFYRFPF
jgi:hypothetical protein